MIRASDGDETRQSIAHVWYTDLVANPLASLESLYERFGLTLSGPAADSIRQFTTEEPSGGYGANRYRLEDYGLAAAAEREKFAEYMNFFGIEPENDPVGDRMVSRS